MFTLSLEGLRPFLRHRGHELALPLATGDSGGFPSCRRHHSSLYPNRLHRNSKPLHLFSVSQV